MVKPKVASAIDGAAPNNPAKLLGRNASLSIAKRLTTRPPTRKRITKSDILLFLLALLRIFDQLQCSVRSLTSQKLILLSLEIVVVHEEDLQFFDPFLLEDRQFLYIRVHVVGLSDGHESVVPDSLLTVDLLTFDDSD
jgi:hypothetical protein